MIVSSRKLTLDASVMNVVAAKAIISCVLDHEIIWDGIDEDDDFSDILSQLVWLLNIVIRKLKFVFIVMKTSVFYFW